MNFDVLSREANRNFGSISGLKACVIFFQKLEKKGFSRFFGKGSSLGDSLCLNTIRVESAKKV